MRQEDRDGEEGEVMGVACQVGYEGVRRGYFRLKAF